MSGDNIKGRSKQRIRYKIPTEQSTRRKRRKRKKLLFAIGMVVILIIVSIWINHNIGIKNVEPVHPEVQLEE